MPGLMHNLRRLVNRALRRRSKSGRRRPAGARAASSQRRGNNNSSNSATPTGTATPTSRHASRASSRNASRNTTPTSKASLTPPSKTSTPTTEPASSSSCRTTPTNSSFASSSGQATPPPLPTAAQAELRNQVLSVLSSEGVLSSSSSDLAASAPPAAGNPATLRLWLPDATLTACFVDFLNVRLRDPELLLGLLRGRVRVANCDVEAVRGVLDEDTTVKELVRCRFQEMGAMGDGKENNGVALFFSFCLGRAVLLQEFQHCSRCNMCFDWRYWHCSECDRCSLGLSLGRCDHCGAFDRDLLALNSSSDNSDAQEPPAMSVGAPEPPEEDEDASMMCYLSLPRRKLQGKAGRLQSVETVSQLLYESSEIGASFHQ